MPEKSIYLFCSLSATDVWRLFDTDGDGLITMEELQEIVRKVAPCMVIP